MPSFARTSVDEASETPVAREVRRLAMEQWGERRPTVILGRHRSLGDALTRVARLALSDGPVVITGETGTGKELFGRAVYLLSRRRSRPFIAVNCAQYQEGQLIASELFGHKRGSFTGAVTDHRGVFEEADGGVVFLDEVGELSLAAQAMLLRVIGDGEIVPVGGTESRLVNVRVIAATNRDLRPLVDTGAFRVDLYYRLRQLALHVPPLRERGDDWELIAAYQLRQLSAQPGAQNKRLSTAVAARLADYHWPGNVREVRSVVDTAFHVSSGDVIEYEDIAAELEDLGRRDQLRRVPMVRAGQLLVDRMIGGHESFWDVIYRPYLRRELSRDEVRDVIEIGLDTTRGSYKRLLPVFGIAPTDYLKFMDFLRHQQLKART